MAVNINTVYQRVLALANKEQRGYITPQEFNLFANLAQVDIFEQYFYDLNRVMNIPGNDTQVSDVDEIIKDKIQIFEREDNNVILNSDWGYSTFSNSYENIPEYVHRILNVLVGSKLCEILKTNDYLTRTSGPRLTRPTVDRPIANIRNNTLRVISGDTGVTQANNVSYIRRPEQVSWGYVVVNEKALYDSNPLKTINFELHASEESELVYKILKFAGITLKAQDVVQIGQALEQTQIQQEK
tara:strand:+ start:104 stop:829 length:726 start_codon:yes stop_codon:yes gene_type:complete